jgi:hypothetical protein
MITCKEYKMLKKIEKNNVSDELLKYANQPKDIKRLHETEALKKLENNNSEKEIKSNQNKEYSKKFRMNMNTITRLNDRDLIKIIFDKFIDVKGPKGNNIRTLTRFYRLTDRGYEMLLDYRRSYKFWIPIVISIIGALTGIISLLISYKTLNS